MIFSAKRKLLEVRHDGKIGVILVIALMAPQRSLTFSAVAKEFSGASIVTMTLAPSVTLIDVIVAAELSLKTLAVAVEAPQGSVTTISKLIWSLDVFKLKVEELAGPFDAIVITFVK